MNEQITLMISTAQRMGFSPAHNDGEHFHYTFPLANGELKLTIFRDGGSQLSWHLDESNWSIIPFNTKGEPGSESIDPKEFEKIALEFIEPTSMLDWERERFDSQE